MITDFDLETERSVLETDRSLETKNSLIIKRNHSGITSASSQILGREEDEAALEEERKE